MTTVSFSLSPSRHCHKIASNASSYAYQETKLFNELKSLHEATKVALDLSNNEAQYFERIMASLCKEIGTLEQQIHDAKLSVLSKENEIRANGRSQQDMLRPTTVTRRRKQARSLSLPTSTSKPSVMQSSIATRAKSFCSSFLKVF